MTQRSAIPIYGRAGHGLSFLQKPMGWTTDSQFLSGPCSSGSCALTACRWFKALNILTFAMARILSDARHNFQVRKAPESITSQRFVYFCCFCRCFCFLSPNCCLFLFSDLFFSAFRMCVCFPKPADSRSKSLKFWIGFIVFLPKFIIAIVLWYIGHQTPMKKPEEKKRGNESARDMFVLAEMNMVLYVSPVGLKMESTSRFHNWTCWKYYVLFFSRGLKQMEAVFLVAFFCRKNMFGGLDW